MDRYREVIQRHGPHAAEGVIRSISHALAQRLRPYETLARIGGDEFAAVLPGTAPHLLRSLADDLCTAVREQSHTVGSSRVHATVSIGGAFLDPGTPTHNDALAAAHTALHKAKVAGGDRAIVHERAGHVGHRLKAGSRNDPVGWSPADQSHTETWYARKTVFC